MNARFVKRGEDSSIDQSAAEMRANRLVEIKKELSKMLNRPEDPAVWWETWNVNLKGPYLMTRAFLPLMLKGGDKTIISTSSVGAHLISPTLSAYQPTKLALLRLMQFVSEEYKDQGVLTYCIHPGNIPTDMIGGREGLSDILKPGR